MILTDPLWSIYCNMILQCQSLHGSAHEYLFATSGLIGIGHDKSDFDISVF